MSTETIDAPISSGAKLKPTGNVTGKILVRGNIETTSPALIGKGKGDELDMELILDDSGKPYIPGSSFAGMFSHYFARFADFSLQREAFKQFFGTSPDTPQPHYQSHCAIENLILNSDCKVSIRDGVKIDPVKGIAKDKSKYDYEILEPGAVFQFEAEVTIRHNFNKTHLLAILFFLKEEGNKENLRIGAFTSFGFGKWKWNDFKIYNYDFHPDSLYWLVFQESRFAKQVSFAKDAYQEGNFKKEDQIKCNRRIFTIHASFEIKNSLIVGYYGINPNEPDKTHIKSMENAVLPGKSTKGAIRNRALKILNTINKPFEILDKLMGWVKDPEEGTAYFNDKKEEIKRIKSRLTIDEAVINGAVADQTQPRVKIDRFIGGASESALFDSQPLWHKNETFELVFTIENPEEYEIGLMLLLLKDLWTADLPIGGEKNIGRGVLKGKKAILRIDEMEEVSILENDDGLEIEPEGTDLEKYVTALTTLNTSAI